MELYLPSIIILLLAGLVIFAILPRLGPLILIVIVSAMLAITGYHHATLFSQEYAMSTWQTSVYNTAAPFMIAMVVLLCIGFGLNLIRRKAAGESITMPAVPEMGTNTLRSLIRDPFKSA
jgi:uncharacterized membrane protein